MNSRVSRVVDRWIWAVMGALFLGVSLLGFVPEVLATLRSKHPPIPWFLHLHAVVMTAWLVLLLVQTTLAALGNLRLHRKLGVASLVLAPLMLASMALLAGHELTGPRAAHQTLKEFAHGVSFAAFIQARSWLLFALFFGWAWRTRRGDPATHKRMMVLATWVLIDASTNRMVVYWHLPRLAPRYYFDHIWMSLTLVPIVLYDVVRARQRLRVWAVGVGLVVPFAIVAQATRLSPPWWQHVVAAITGHADVPLPERFENKPPLALDPRDGEIVYQASYRTEVVTTEVGQERLAVQRRADGTRVIVSEASYAPEGPAWISLREELAPDGNVRAVAFDQDGDKVTVTRTDDSLRVTAKDHTETVPVATLFLDPWNMVGPLIAIADRATAARGALAISVEQVREDGGVGDVELTFMPAGAGAWTWELRGKRMVHGSYELDAQGTPTGLTNDAIGLTTTRQ